MQHIKFDNNAFNFHGRWETTADGVKSHWLRPYFEFWCDKDFKLCISSESGAFSVKVNGQEVEEKDGLFVLNEKSLIRVTANDNGKPLIFKGIETDGYVERAESRKKHILFIGDSLTHSPYSHSVVLPRELDYDYTGVAQGGMSLMVGRGYLNLVHRAGFEGMQVAFFKDRSPVEQGEMLDYDFSLAETPDFIIVNIGTNDHLTDDDYAIDFIKAYIEFIGKVHAMYPNAPMYLALPVADTEGGFRRNTIEKASKECEKLYKGVVYISSRNWNVEISSDGVHPTPEGYGTYAAELLKVLKTFGV